jgi:uncharacterized OB-fold protein
MKEPTASHALNTGLVDIDFTGSRCTKCKTIVFPKKRVCPNCLADGMKEEKLPRVGKVFSLATLYNGVTEDFVIPYTNGYIELTEGLRVFGLIEDGEQGEKPKSGSRVSLSEIRKNKAGQLLYIFRPLPSEEARK